MCENEELSIMTNRNCSAACRYFGITRFLLVTALCLAASPAWGQWATNGNNIYNTNTGNVGIGNAFPQLSLDMHTSSSTMAGIGFGNSLSGPYSTTRGAVLQLSSSALYLANRENGPIYFWTNNSNRITIAANGNVGIGAGSPRSKLEVREFSAVAASFLPVGSGTINYSGYTHNDLLLGSFINVNGYAEAFFSLGYTQDPSRKLHIGSASSSDFNSQTTLVPALTVTSGGTIGLGTPNPNLSSRLHVVGNVMVDGNIAAKYQDIAEWVPADAALEPGTVVITDPSLINHVVASTKAYDTRVAGVVASKPGIVLGEEGEGKIRVATMGRVMVNVDASISPIQIGDLLVTSGNSGLAMRSQAVNIGGVEMHRPGTLIGKALEPLPSGRGRILVLLSLQ
jgi:hypothetical protein